MGPVWYLRAPVHPVCWILVVSLVLAALSIATKPNPVVCCCYRSWLGAEMPFESLPDDVLRRVHSLCRTTHNCAVVSATKGTVEVVVDFDEDRVNSMVARKLLSSLAEQLRSCPAATRTWPEGETLGENANVTGFSRFTLFTPWADALDLKALRQAVESLPDVEVKNWAYNLRNPEKRMISFGVEVGCSWLGCVCRGTARAVRPDPGSPRRA